jgi:Protein of unknown function (DUF4235)
MKFLFIPIGVGAGLLAGATGKALFSQVWGLIDEEEPPDSKHKNVPWGKLLLAAALQGAIFRLTKEAVDRASRKGFYNLTGTWPGQEEPEPE